MSAFLRFWVDFIVGDDWRIAAGVVASVLAGALLTAWWVVLLGVSLTLALSLWRK